MISYLSSWKLKHHSMSDLPLMNDIPHQATIMVIDDRPANLNLLVEILTHQGYEIRIFPSGKLALKSAGKNPPDIIILDINMPEMDGFEVCAHLKTHANLKDIPVIFMSALTETRGKIKAFEYGGVDYITKPFQPEEVKARVKIHLALAKTETLEQEINNRIRIEKQYYAQLENLSDAIIHTTADGIIVYINPATESYFGYSREELTGEKVEIIIQDEFSKEHINYRKKYITAPYVRKMTQVRNVHAKRKNGTTFPVNINLSTLFSNEGILISAEIRDISEQQRIEQAFERQSILFEEVFNDIPDAILITGTDHQIVMANPAATFITGYQTDELVGKSPEILYKTKNEFKPHTKENHKQTRTKTTSQKLSILFTTTMKLFLVKS